MHFHLEPFDDISVPLCTSTSRKHHSDRLLCWSSMKADLPLWETGVLDVVLSPPLPPGGPGVTEPRPA
ncbi:hypothetical protein ALC60_07986 [Trachymyrmex zeteki]|uniref:Uncharacterized protein n=1 Tax=Mycetomoellerius zeteki TaxID=64791 RepID=A0A151WYE5_9HYME|nr:hypothetical protein ALC60_07986 [Trachymyrmex zeteki]